MRVGVLTICAGQQLWEIQEGRFGSPVPPDVISILASELGISTDLLEFEKILRLHNVSDVITTFLVMDAQNTNNNMLFCDYKLKQFFYK